MDTNSRAIAQQLDQRRRELGVDMVSLARHSGVSRAMLYRFFGGESDLSIGKLAAVARHLGLQLALLDAEPVRARADKTRRQKRFLAEHPAAATRGFFGDARLGRATIPPLEATEW